MVYNDEYVNPQFENVAKQTTIRDYAKLPYDHSPCLLAIYLLQSEAFSMFIFSS